MSAENPYSVAIEPKEIVVRFDRDFFDQQEIAELLDYLGSRAFASRSQLTDEQIADLADEVNRSGWDRIRSEFLDLEEQ